MDKFQDMDFDSSDSSESEGQQFFCTVSGNESRLSKKQENKEIGRQMYKQYPYNTGGIVLSHYEEIGERRQVCVNGGNGFLISGLLVVTSAHLLCLATKDHIIVFPKQVEFQSKSKGFDMPFKVKVRDFKVHARYEQIQRERMKLMLQKKKVKIRSDLSQDEKSSRRRNIRKQIYSLLKESQKYDIALLRLEVQVILPQYPLLDDVRSCKVQNIFLCGFREKQENQRKNYIIQPQIAFILINQNGGGVYNIDSCVGVSGSGVFVQQNKSKVIGIHKGYDKRARTKICTLLDIKLLAQLKEWVLQFFMFKTNLNIPEAVSKDIKKQVVSKNYMVKVRLCGSNHQIKFKDCTTVGMLVKQVASIEKVNSQSVMLVYKGNQIQSKAQSKLIDIGIKDNDAIQGKVKMPMPIFVKGFNGVNFVVRLTEDATVKDLMGEVVKKTGLESKKMYLIYGGTPISQNQKVKLVDLGIESERTVHAALRLC